MVQTSSFPLQSLLAELVGGATCAGCRARPGPLCRDCRTKAAGAVDRPPPPQVARLVVPWAYDGPVRSLVLDLKLRALTSAAEPLVAAMAAEVWRRGLDGRLLTWVPASKNDNRRRGFDHAEVLARGLGARLGLPVVRLLDRSREVLDQTGLGATERRQNLQRAFGARACSGTVVIVDDVVTTGATLAACAAALRRAGASSIEAVVASSA